MRFVSTLGAYPPSRFNPLPRPLLMRFPTLRIQYLNPLTNKWTSPIHLSLHRIPLLIINRLPYIPWQWHSVRDLFLASAVFPYKRHGRCEYTFPTLARLHGARSK